MATCPKQYWYGVSIKTEKYNQLTDCLIAFSWIYKTVTSAIARCKEERRMTMSPADFIIAHNRKQ